MRAWLAFDAWFARAVPRQRLAVVRFCVGAYALIYLISRGPHLLRPIGYPASSFAPVGVVTILDAPLPAAAQYSIYAVAVLTGALFTTGRWYRSAAPMFALALLWVLSYRHSWGMIFHTDNILALHVVVLALSPAAARAASPDEGAGGAPALVSGWPLRTLCWITVASYFVAGVAKLRLGGLEWVNGGALRQQIAYDALRKLELGSIYSPLGTWLLPLGWLFAPLAAFALLCELGAPLALVGRRARVLWCGAAWAFHAGVLALMAIAFPYPLSGVMFVPFFAVDRAFSKLVQRMPPAGPGRRLLRWLV